MWLIRNLKKSNNSKKLILFYCNGLDNKGVINDMLNDLCELCKSGQLTAPRCTSVDIQDYKTALTNAMKPFVSSKQLIMFNKLL